MKKVSLSPAVKQLIASRGSPVGSTAGQEKLAQLLDALHKKSQVQTSKNALLTVAVGTLFALNAPHALKSLWKWTDKTPAEASLMREGGLKSISFIGIASVINNLGVLHECFAADGISQHLSNQPKRISRLNTIRPAFERGRELWDSIYRPHHDKLISKLGQYHPDLPVHILESHYSLVLSDPSPVGPLGRTLTSILAIACLQGQTGVGSQATSHVFGLKKALEDGSAENDVPEEGLSLADKQWLGGDDGTEWILQSVESLRQAVNEDAAVKAKL